MKATDKDAGENARITYVISGPANEKNVFQINPNTGVVTTREKLDYETKNRYVLSLTAYDNGK